MSLRRTGAYANMPTESSIHSLLATVKKLRSPSGCPWDKEQTHASLRRFLLEEAHESLEALDAYSKKQGKEETHNLKDELGDLLFQVLLHAELADENGAFNFQDICQNLEEKLKRRHPHVFGSANLESSEKVIEHWDKIKNGEKKKDSLLDGIPVELPSLQKAQKIIEKASRVGFQWPNLEGPWKKLEEELQELKTEIENIAVLSQVTPRFSGQLSAPVKQKLEAELGDLLFCVANLAHFLQVNPEDSLRSMLKRFEARFRYVENKAKEDGKKIEELTLVQMDVFWDEAKKLFP